MWAVTVSNITGLKDLKGDNVEGYIISIPIIVEQMLEDRQLAEDKILQAVKLAKNKGCKIVGLGGLTASLTAGGKVLKEKIDGIYITTGHAYTGYNVTRNVFELANFFSLNISDLKVALVGATGSVGSISAQILARSGFNHFILIDVERKKERFDDVVNKMKIFNTKVKVEISHNVSDIKSCNIVVTATNTKEALIKNEHVKSGMIIVDDAQPSDVSEEVLKRDDIFVVEAGVVHTPGILSNFNLGLKNKEDNFCCMAEVLCLASLKHKDHFVIHRASIEDIDKIVDMSKHLNFKLGKFQNRLKQFKEEEILQFKNKYYT
jgi:predicted amino acid dehydrogenase